MSYLGFTLAVASVIAVTILRAYLEEAVRGHRLFE